MTAVVVLKPGQTTTGDNQIAHARQRRAGYKPQIHRRGRFPPEEPEPHDFSIESFETATPASPTKREHRDDLQTTPRNSQPENL